MANEKNEPYNPLDKLNLGLSVANAILNEPLRKLPPGPFSGIGVYAIYYTGKHPAYDVIANFNKREQGGWPVYVGKAIASGGRKGVLSDVSSGKKLYNRLMKHAKTLEHAENLSLADFQCRFLIVDSIWIPLGEQLLIEKYRPIWNSLIDGFGNNDPGRGRHQQKVSVWDTLHPGRHWAKKLVVNHEVSLAEQHAKMLEWQKKQEIRLLNR